MPTFVQRQFASFMAEGTSKDPVTYPPPAKTWNFRDVVPSTILELADGKLTTQEVTIAAGASHTMVLPQRYSSARPMFILILTNRVTRVVVSPLDSGGTTSLIRAGLAADQPGFQCFYRNINVDIVLTNTAATAAIMRYLTFELPDLSLAASYRDGTQTTGTVTA